MQSGCAEACVVVLALVLAAVLTPPDPLSMLLAASPILLVVGILHILRRYRGRCL